MATCHRGSGNPLDRDIDMTSETQNTADTNIEDMQGFNPDNTDHFEDPGYTNPTK